VCGARRLGSRFFPLPEAALALGIGFDGLVKVSVHDMDLRLEAICAGQVPGEDEVRCADGEIMDNAVIGEAQLGMSGSPASRRRMASAASSK